MGIDVKGPFTRDRAVRVVDASRRKCASSASGSMEIFFLTLCTLLPVFLHPCFVAFTGGGVASVKARPVMSE
jgi:hypothetical protein